MVGIPVEFEMTHNFRNKNMSRIHNYCIVIDNNLI